MASIKIFALVALIVAIAAVGVNAKNLVSGRRVLYDKLACYGDVHLEAIPGFKREAQRICSLDAKKLINYIEVKDLGAVNNGAVAAVQTGGVLYNNVTLFFQGASGKPVDFSINVYAVDLA